MKTLVRNPRFWLAWLCVFMLAAGIFTAGDYGVYCDQLSEQVILRENLKEYALRLLGPDSEAARYYTSLGVQAAGDSIEIDHGQCAYYPLAPALALADSAALHLWWHGYTWLWFVLGCWALYGLLREMGMGRALALLGMALLFLSPRFFAEGHYNNKDVLLLVLALCTFYLGLRLLKKPTVWRGVLFSLAGAMAANTKIAGLVPWGLCSLCAVFSLCARRGWNKGTVAAAVATLGSFCAFYALLTPAMWRNPAYYFQYLLQNASGFTRWPGVVWFRGMGFEHKINPLPRYYLPYMLLTTLPLYFFPLCAVGQLSALKEIRRAPAQPKSLLLLCAMVLWALFLGYAVLARPLMYNGWRHFYFLCAGFLPLAAQGMQCLWSMAKRPVYRRALAGLCALCLAVTGIGIARNHPYQYAYYNPLAARGAQGRLELDYWDVSTLNALRRLLNEAQERSLPLTVGALDEMSLFGLNVARAALSEAELARLQITEEPGAPYLFVNATYETIYGVEIPQGYHALFALGSYGNVICRVYERD